MKKHRHNFYRFRPLINTAGLSNHNVKTFNH